MPNEPSEPSGVPVGMSATRSDYELGLGNETVAIYEGGNVLQAERYEMGYGYIDASGVRHYYIRDNVGSVRVVVRQDGAMEETNDYYAYGAPRESWSVINNKYGKYLGKELDGESGTLHLGAREFEMWLPRFNRLDPMAEQAPGWSGYCYSFDNPLKYSDESGNFGIPTHGKHSNQTTAAPVAGTAAIPMQAPPPSLTYGGGGMSPGAMVIGSAVAIVTAVNLLVESVNSYVPPAPTAGTTTAMPDATGVNVPNIPGFAGNPDLGGAAPTDAQAINTQKQAGHIPGTPQYENRVKQGKPTSGFFGEKSAEVLTQETWQNGTAVGGKPNVKEKDFGVSVGTGPKGGTQTKVRVHQDKDGKIHGHPSGPETK